MVSKYCLNFKSLSCGKICAATMCCIPLNHNISYDILISFIFNCDKKSDFFSITLFQEDECHFLKQIIMLNEPLFHLDVCYFSVFGLKDDSLVWALVSTGAKSFMSHFYNPFHPNWGAFLIPFSLTRLRNTPLSISLERNMFSLVYFEIPCQGTFS